MKSMLIIGMGRFGQHLCRNLSELGHQIMIIDKEEDRLEEMLAYSEEAKIGDCTNIEVLKSLGVGNYDAAFVCIGTDFQSSLEATSLLKELGAKYVVSKATRDIQAKFLLRNGADEVIYPDRDIAMKTAIRYSSNHIFDFIEFVNIPLSKSFFALLLQEILQYFLSGINFSPTKNFTFVKKYYII